MHDSLPVSMGSQVIDMLDQWGPERCECVPLEHAAAYCRRLTLGQYENFSVLSRFVPDEMRDGVSAVYAFCRWADDLSDESEDAAVALSRLEWWRSELRFCEQGTPRHPVFVALAPMVDRYGLDTTLFHRLLDAVEQDQRQNRYDTWGDILERNRVYIPRTSMPTDDFEQRQVMTAKVGHAPDAELLREYRAVCKGLVERTRPLLSEVQVLLDEGPPELRSMLWLFAAGGVTILDLIERADHETVLFRVSISKPRKLWLLWTAARKGRAA